MGKKFCLLVYRSKITYSLYRVDVYGDVQYLSIQPRWINCGSSAEFFRQSHFKLIAKNVMFKCPA